MDNLTAIFICVLCEIICIVTLIHDIREDRKTDRERKLEYFRNEKCTEKTWHCDYCGTDGCGFHPNND